MKKILFLFYNAGAGVHVANSMVEDAVRSLPYDLTFCREYGNDSSATYYYPLIVKDSPDIIVLQDFFPGLIQAAVDYKMQENAACKILLFSFTTYPTAADIDKALLEKLDGIYLPHRDNPVVDTPAHVNTFHPPLNLSRFKPYRSWADREKVFCSIGRLIDTKCSVSLLSQFQNYKAPYDYYANRVDVTARDQTYCNLVASFNEFATLHPQLTRGQVARTLNNYKYHILLAEGDCFSIITLEALACGTIPILICSTNRRQGLLSWLPESFGLHYRSIEDFANDIPRLQTVDLSKKSKDESLYIRAHYNQADFYAQVASHFS